MWTFLIGSTVNASPSSKPTRVGRSTTTTLFDLVWRLASPAAPPGVNQIIDWFREHPAEMNAPSDRKL